MQILRELFGNIDFLKKIDIRRYNSNIILENINWKIRVNLSLSWLKENIILAVIYMWSKILLLCTYIYIYRKWEKENLEST